MPGLHCLPGRPGKADMSFCGPAIAQGYRERAELRSSGGCRTPTCTPSHSETKCPHLHFLCTPLRHLTQIPKCSGIGSARQPEAKPTSAPHGPGPFTLTSSLDQVRPRAGLPGRGWDWERFLQENSPDGGWMVATWGQKGQKDHRGDLHARCTNAGEAMTETT